MRENGDCSATSGWARTCICRSDPSGCRLTLVPCGNVAMWRSAPVSPISSTNSTASPFSASEGTGLRSLGEIVTCGVERRESDQSVEGQTLTFSEINVKVCVVKWVYAGIQSSQQDTTNLTQRAPSDRHDRKKPRKRPVCETYIRVVLWIRPSSPIPNEFPPRCWRKRHRVINLCSVCSSVTVSNVNNGMIIKRRSCDVLFITVRMCTSD